MSLLLCLWLLRPPSAEAQDPRLTARLDSTTRVQVEAVVDSARTDGLPTEPLVQKALEGSSKGASGPRIVAAVSVVLSDLRRAREALGRTSGSDELVAAAAALRAGATPEMVGEIRSLDPRSGVAVPLAVFTDLVADGMRVDDAWRSVTSLARQGGDEQAFLRLRDRLRPTAGPP